MKVTVEVMVEEEESNETTPARREPQLPVTQGFLGETIKTLATKGIYFFDVFKKIKPHSFAFTQRSDT